jgi:RHS repeat-associated protein
VVWSATYDSFGNAQIGVEAITNNLRFAGQYYDAETGLHYNLNRYYDPSTGRYLRTDPYGDGLNLYVYVFNNPVKSIDAWGLCAASRVGDNISQWWDNLHEFIKKPVTSYYGLGGSAFYGNQGSTTASGGAILYSNKTGWFGGNYLTYGSEKAPLDDIETALGAGAGVGVQFGVIFGSLDDLEGKSRNLSFSLFLVGVTYTETQSTWGLSIDLGSKGVGLGYFIYEANTLVWNPSHQPQRGPIVRMPMPRRPSEHFVVLPMPPRPIDGY